MKTKYYAMLDTTLASWPDSIHGFYLLITTNQDMLLVSYYYILIGEFDELHAPTVQNETVYVYDGRGVSPFITKSEMYNAYKTTKLFLK